MGRRKKFPAIPEADVIERFLRRFNSIMNGGDDKRKYWEIIHELAQKKVKHLWIDLDDLEHYSSDLANKISHDVKNYTKLFSDIAAHIYYGIVDKMPSEPEVNQIIIDSDESEPSTSSAQQTKPSGPVISSNLSDSSGTQCTYKYFVCSELRPFKLFFRPLSKKRCTSMRALNCTGSNQLVTVRGIVKEVDHFERMLKGRRIQRVKKFQEFTLIEPLDQVPVGASAKTIRAVATDDCITPIDAGDHVIVTAVLLPYFVELDDKPEFDVEKMMEVQQIEVIDKVKMEAYEEEVMKLRPKRKKKKSTVGYCEQMDSSCQTDFLPSDQPVDYIDLESEYLSGSRPLPLPRSEKFKKMIFKFRILPRCMCPK